MSSGVMSEPLVMEGVRRSYRTAAGTLGAC
jgi:hypothetical protein